MIDRRALDQFRDALSVELVARAVEEPGLESDDGAMLLWSTSRDGALFAMPLDPGRLGERAYVLACADAWMRAAGRRDGPDE